MVRERIGDQEERRLVQHYGGRSEVQHRVDYYYERDLFFHCSNYLSYIILIIYIIILSFFIERGKDPLLSTFMHPRWSRHFKRSIHHIIGKFGGKSTIESSYI